MNHKNSNIYEDNEEHLSDIVRGDNADGIQFAIEEIRDNFLDTIEWMKKNTKRNKKIRY